jgi:hypothetical protein
MHLHATSVSLFAQIAISNGWVGLATSSHCGLLCRQHGLICHVSFVRSHQDRLSCEMCVEFEVIFDMRCDVVDRAWMTMSNGNVVKNAIFFYW